MLSPKAVRAECQLLSGAESSRTAFGESIYHGAALSAVADGKGGMHLVYKDDAERLRYRHFNGSSFGSSLIIESKGDWALQPAITRQGSELVIFYNRPRGGERYDMVVRRLRGSSLSGATTLDSSATFKGYPNAVDVLPTGMSVPVLFGNAANASRSGTVSVTFAASSSSRASSTDEEVSALGDGDVPAPMDGTGGSGPLATGPTGGAEALPEMGCGGAGGVSAMMALGASVLGLLGMRRLRRREEEETQHLVPVRVRSEP